MTLAEENYGFPHLFRTTVSSYYELIAFNMTLTWNGHPIV